MSAYLMSDAATCQLAVFAVAAGLAADEYLAATALRHTNNKAMSARYSDKPVKLAAADFDAARTAIVAGRLDGGWEGAKSEIAELVNEFTYQCEEGDAMETTPGGDLLARLADAAKSGAVLVTNQAAAMSNTAATNYTAEQLVEIRAEAQTLELADLPKGSLVALTRRVFGKVGDSARTSKADYLARLAAAGRDALTDSIVAMVVAGELTFGIDDESGAPPAAKRKAAVEQAGAIEAGAAVEQMRAAFKALGIVGNEPATAALDEERVREIAAELDIALGAKWVQEVAREAAEIKAQLMALYQSAPERVVVVNSAGERKEVAGTVHAAFDRVLSHASIRDNTLLVGPAGCGKTALAHQVADALSLPFAFLSCTAGMSESQVQGWLLPVGESGRFSYVPSAFVTMYENGGVFLIDELDAADENMLMVLNSALANGRMSIPQRHEAPVATRHADFVVIAAANTYGHGADRTYAGRNQLDGATLDRFRTAIVDMDYDAKLERQIVDSEALAWGLSIREAIKTHKLRRVMSTRSLVGFSRQKAALKWGAKEWERSYFADWTRDELSRVGR